MKFFAIAVTAHGQLNTDTASTQIVAEDIAAAISGFTNHVLAGRLELPLATADTLILAVCTQELADRLEHLMRN